MSSRARPDSSLGDAELERLRQDLYALAEVALENSSCRKALPATNTQRNLKPLFGAPPAGPLPRKVMASCDDKYATNERTAILEFDAGMFRSEAEDKANLRSQEYAFRMSRCVLSSIAESPPKTKSRT